MLSIDSVILEASASWKDLAGDCITMFSSVSLTMSLNQFGSTYLRCQLQLPSEPPVSESAPILRKPTKVLLLLGRILIFKDEPVTERI